MALLVLLAFTAVLIYFVPFLMAILPGFYAYLGSFFIERIFKKYLAEEIKKSSNEYVTEVMKRLDESVTQNLVEIRKARQALESGREQT